MTKLSSAPRIIALHSALPGSGKSAVAAGLANHGYITRLLSQPLLDHCFQRIRADMPAATEAQVWTIIHEHKDEPEPSLGNFSPREFMSDTVRSWRKEFGDEILAVMASPHIDQQIQSGNKVVLDGLRNNGEARYLQTVYSATFVQIERTRDTASDVHDNNTLKEWPFHFIIENDGSLAQLTAAASQLVACREGTMGHRIRASDCCIPA